ncbi:MAG: hypothetical protein QMD09_11340 [Desulfatibacillaceae bacterium]|nr:hypothetical protein [Desulfatibacillaceae bacterium]
MTEIPMRSATQPSFSWDRPNTKGRVQGDEGKAHKTGRNEVYLLYDEFLHGEVQRSHRLPGTAPKKSPWQPLYQGLF